METAPSVRVSAADDASTNTRVVMHNVILNESAGLKLRVRWLRGQMHPTHPGVNPSFDDPKSFWLDIEAGALGISLSDLAGALNSGLLKGLPLQKVSITPYAIQMKLKGTLHKGIPLPIEIISDIGVWQNHDILVHVAKVRILKMPVGGLLKTFRIGVGDLVDPKGSKGVRVQGDDIYLVPSNFCPPPKKCGTLTDVHIAKTGDIVEVYGSAKPEIMKVKEWRNFIGLRGGTLEFGKLTMRNADIMMIDISKDNWFNFDLSRYQEQIVNGYTRMTPQAGMQIFMPDIDKIPHNKANQSISLQWIKNRNVSPPADITH
jgi:hypothetical protein